MIRGLVDEKDSNGEFTLVCDKCRTRPDQTYGAPNRGQRAYILRCGTCGKIFGQWNSPDTRDAELQELAKRRV
jgi:hypothetical protein